MTIEQMKICDRELKKLDERFNEFMKVANSTRVAQKIFRQPMFTDPLGHGARFWISLFTAPNIDTFYYVVAEEKTHEKRPRKMDCKAMPTEKVLQAVAAYYEEIKIKRFGAVARTAQKFGISPTMLRRLVSGSYKKQLGLIPEDEVAVKAIALPVVFAVALNEAENAQ